MESQMLIKSLIKQTENIIKDVENFETLDLKYLLKRRNQNEWNILECLEHLNLYGDFYLPQIEKAILNSNYKFDINFKTGILGNYFAKSMLPKNKIHKMNTFKDKNPINKNLDKNVIENFIKQQFKIIELLNQSKKISLNKTKVSTSISRFIKLNLGDTYQFIVNHNIRHLKQIELIKKSISL